MLIRTLALSTIALSEIVVACSPAFPSRELWKDPLYHDYHAIDRFCAAGLVFTADVSSSGAYLGRNGHRTWGRLYSLKIVRLLRGSPRSSTLPLYTTVTSCGQTKLEVGAQYLVLAREQRDGRGYLEPLAVAQGAQTAELLRLIREPHPSWGKDACSEAAIEMRADFIQRRWDEVTVDKDRELIEETRALILQERSKWD